MFSTLKNWLLGLLVAFAIFGCIVAPLNRCTPTVGPENGKRVDTVLQVRHDTIKVLKDSLRVKIVYRDTGRIEYIHDDLDKAVPPIGDENVMIAENQLRECMKCRDSLEFTKKVIAVDSQTIDSLAKIAKAPQIEKTCTFTEQVKSFGMGTLFGITIRSFF